MNVRLAIAVDPELLATDLAAFLRDKEQCRHYLDMSCGKHRTCEVILSASSFLIANKDPAAHAALSQARAQTADVLLRYVYGEEVEIKDEGKLAELFDLARAVGVESCINKCRSAILHAAFLTYPLKLRATADEARQRHARLQQFKKDCCYTNLKLTANQAGPSDSKSAATTNEFVVHAVMLAAASKYFSATWKQVFADGFRPGVAFNVDANARQLEWLIRTIYGETVELCISDLLDLLSLADRWQVSRVSTIVLAQLQEHFASELVQRILTKSQDYPEPLLHMAFFSLGPQLRVIAPRHTHLEGTYKFACRFANAQPVWHKIDGSFMLYSGLNDHWCFFSSDVVEHSTIQANTCCLVSQQPHSGLMPHEMHGCWQSCNGHSYIQDPTVIPVVY